VPRRAGAAQRRPLHRSSAPTRAAPGLRAPHPRPAGPPHRPGL